MSSEETNGNITSLLKNMGPAWIISAVACGPATLASVSIAGAEYGYAMLWVVVLSAVFGATAQYLAARIGVLEGCGIISAVRRHMGPVWAWILTIDALLATWLAAMVLMNALSGITSMVLGVSTPWWGVGYGILIGAFLIWRGYRGFEMYCKILVGFVVVCFIATVFMADLSVAGMMSGLAPGITGGAKGAMMMAAIMGGAVHITIIGMHTYTVNARGWRKPQLRLARTDTILSMGVAFGFYSMAIFLVAAAVLHPNGVVIKRGTEVALALEPLLGGGAMQIFLIGLWAAALSTISPTFLAGGYFIADLAGWDLTVKDRRFAAAVAVGCVISMIGPFAKGGFFLLLPLMLALGLAGTPLIIALILYLLNFKTDAADRPSAPLNILGGVTLLITLFLAVRFVATKVGCL